MVSGISNCMKIIIAPDSFKESLDAKNVGLAIKRGLEKVWPNAIYHVIPMADGGEGSLHALIDACDGSYFSTRVKDPLGNLCTAQYGICGDHKQALIEMAAASGLELVPLEKRNPYRTSSYGTGELIKSALDKGIRSFILGIGGSATNDGGSGMLKALGVRFLDENRQELPEGGVYLNQLDSIDLSRLDKRLHDSHFEVACDVNNPLCGPNGASAVFGPQKGASPDMVETLDKALNNYAEIIKHTLNKDVLNCPGAGAAGGLGAGILAFFNCNFQRGIDLIANMYGLDSLCKDADFVFTGEGKIDRQTIFGKTPIGVARIAKHHGVRVIAFTGTLGDGYELVYEYGIDAVFPIICKFGTQDDIFSQTAENLEKTAQNIALLINISKLEL